MSRRTYLLAKILAYLFLSRPGCLPEQFSPSLNSELLLIGELPVPNEDEELLGPLAPLLLLHQLAIVGEELEVLQIILLGIKK